MLINGKSQLKRNATKHNATRQAFPEHSWHLPHLLRFCITKPGNSDISPKWGHAPRNLRVHMSGIHLWAICWFQPSRQHNGVFLYGR